MSTTNTETTNMNSNRYLEPDFFSRKVFNPFVAFLTRRGLSVWGSRVLGVKGRTSGQWREVPVNLLTVDGVDYLVAPRGTTQWVRNLRVAGTGRFRLGRRQESFAATELEDSDKAIVLRSYLTRWSWEVGAFFDGINAQSSDDKLIAAGPDHPIFRVTRG